MSGKMLQFNFKFNLPRHQYEQVVLPLGRDFATLHGLRWKIWLIHEATYEAAGWYCFDSEASCNAFLDGPLASQVLNHPALSAFSVKPFDVLSDITALTRGPVSEEADFYSCHPTLELERMSFPLAKEAFTMAVYMVDRDLSGITQEQLAAAQKAAIETSQQFTTDGKSVRYIRSTFLPSTSQCMCLFEADNADHVKGVNEAANLPYTKIVEAMDLTP